MAGTSVGSEQPWDSATITTRRTRADQLEANRAAILRAAVQVVGDEGYAKASVGKITAAAGLGQGTFYTYFRTRQDLFDVLLPEVNEDLLEYVRARVKGSRSVAEVEERSYLAYTDYVIANPRYAKIFFEAETMAPRAAEVNAYRVLNSHIRRLELAWDQGELPDFLREEVPALSAGLMSIRRHFARSQITTQLPNPETESHIAIGVKMIRRILTPLRGR